MSRVDEDDAVDQGNQLYRGLKVSKIAIRGGEPKVELRKK